MHGGGEASRTGNVRIVDGHVKLPNGITRLEGSAFYGCKDLISVVIPSSVKTIGAHAFYSCTALSSVTFPSSLKTIEDCAFANCTALASASFPASLKVIGPYAFDRCTALASVIFPSSLEVIGHVAFKACTSLKSVTMPYGVETIGINAFGDCRALRTVEIPSSVLDPPVVRIPHRFSHRTIVICLTEAQEHARQSLRRLWHALRGCARAVPVLRRLRLRASERAYAPGSQGFGSAAAHFHSMASAM